MSRLRPEIPNSLNMDQTETAKQLPAWIDERLCLPSDFLHCCTCDMRHELPSSSCKSQKGIRWHHSEPCQPWNPGRLSSSGKGFIDNTCAHIREQCLSAVVPQQLFSYRSTATSQHWRKLWKQRSQMQRPRTKVVSHVQHRVDLNSVTLDASEL